MKFLIVGAGASYQEGKSFNLLEEQCLPLLKNFASQLWTKWVFPYKNHYEIIKLFLDYDGNLPSKNELSQNITPETEFRVTYINPHSISINPQHNLDDFIPDKQPLNKFIELEKQQKTNVEKFFEFFWQLQETDSKIFSPIWKNFIYWNVRQPLEMLIKDAFISNDMKMKELKSTKRIIKSLNGGDVVISLNYDTLFEIGLIQSNKKFIYAPLPAERNTIRMAKPHGSMNLAYIKSSGAFGFEEPFCYGKVPSSNLDLSYGLVPPRLNKTYKQNSITKIILDSIKDYRPNIITFWGIGLTESDLDILSLFRTWCKSAHKIEFINPSRSDAEKASHLLRKKIIHYENIEDWEASTSHTSEAIFKTSR